MTDIILGKTGKPTLEIRTSLLLQVLKYQRHLLGYLIYGYIFNLYVLHIFINLFTFFLCLFNTLMESWNKAGEKKGSSVRKLTSAVQASVVSLFLIPWPDFDASQFSCELRQWDKEVISPRQRGLLQMPLLPSSDKKSRIPLYQGSS